MDMTTTQGGESPDTDVDVDGGGVGEEDVDTRPVLFISHKHVDVDIARQLQQALLELLEDAVRIHNTSDARGEGPRAGDPLGDSIRSILHETSVVFLLYTADEEDWRWCFYECGVANDPVGDVPTRTVVFDFGTERGSGVFTGDLHLDIARDLAQSDDSDVQAPAEFRRFIRDLVMTDEYVPIPEREWDEADEDDLFHAADRLYEDLLELGPATQLELAEEMTRALRSVPAMDRRRRFAPLFRDAARALEWGLDPSRGVRELFVEYWNERLLGELQTLASRQLVFRPGRVHVEWSRLLRVCRTWVEEHPRRVRRLGRPVLAFVSDETGVLADDDRSDAFGFWQGAQEKWSDPWWYEDPVRNLSGWLRDEVEPQPDAPPLVERVFVVDGASFDEGTARRVAELATWMGEAGITTSVAFRNSRSSSDEQEFADFGLIGDIAETRFAIEPTRRAGRPDSGEHVESLRYRSLRADFHSDSVAEAARAWTRLQEHVDWTWRGTGVVDPERLHHDVMKAR